MDHRATDDCRRAARAGVSSRRVVPFALVLATCGVFTFPVWESLLERLGAAPESLEAGGRWHRPFSANDLSNLATIRALVEQGTWAIDRSGFQSSDQALIDGRYYSVRPPVLALLASGVYWVLFHVLGWQLTPQGGFGACHWLLVLIFSGGSLALTAVLLGERSSGPKERDTHSLARPLAHSLLFAWGSLALPYAVVFNHHIVAACLITVVAACLIEAERAGKLRLAPALVAGLCAGLAATIDVAGGGLFLLGFLGWVVTVPALRKQIVWGAVAVAAAAGLHGALNWQITGDVVPVLVRPEYIEFPGATLKGSQLSGFFNHESPGEFFAYVGGLLLASPGDGFSPRGLFVYTPAAFFALLVAVRIIRLREHPLRWAAVYLGGASVVYLVYLALFTNNYSGGCYGVRWFVLLLPAIYLLLFGGWELLSRWERVSAAIALAASIPLAWSGLIYGTWQGTEVFPLVVHYTWAMPLLFLVALAPQFLGRRITSRMPP